MDADHFETRRAIIMHTAILINIVSASQPAIAMCVAGIVVFMIGAMVAKRDLSGAHGLDRIAVLGPVCFAVPLAVFGAFHLFGPDFVKDIVPDYMPWQMFWVYFVGLALIAASVSIAAGIWMHWSGLLFGIMMFLFVAMIYIPGVISTPQGRYRWILACREMSFGGGGWLLAGSVIDGWPRNGNRKVIFVGRICVTIALFLFGVEHFLHPTGLPGVPLQKQIPTWIPGREIVDYITGAALLIAGGSVLLSWKTRAIAACVGGWILLTVLLIYGPVMIGALADPEVGVQVEGINYFADTLLFAGTVLALAKVSPRSRQANS